MGGNGLRPNPPMGPKQTLQSMLLALNIAYRTRARSEVFATTEALCTYP